MSCIVPSNRIGYVKIEMPKKRSKQFQFNLSSLVLTKITNRQPRTKKIEEVSNGKKLNANSVSGIVDGDSF